MSNQEEVKMYCVSASIRCRRAIRVIVCLLLFSVITACHGKAVRETFESALTNPSPRIAAPIPRPTSALPILPKPAARTGAKADLVLTASRRSDINEQRLPHTVSADASDFGTAGLFSVVVQKVPAHEVLFSLARDSALELDIIGEVVGSVTLNAVNQPLERILQKISNQVAIRYELLPGALVVVADTPEIRSYQVDYLNISRATQSRVDLATQIGSISSLVGGQETSSASNGSRMSIENSSENNFWQTLYGNIAGIIGESSAGVADAATVKSENIFVNRESGIIAVRATNKQHRIIDSLITEVVDSAQRQVLIEATVVEVTLSDSFESGIDWRILDNNGGTALEYAQILSGTPTAGDAVTPNTGLLSYSSAGGSLGDVTATLKVLQQFGDVQVLSSPKIIALNNQPAVLKVVDNRVYFTFEVDRQQRENGDTRTIVDSTVHSVPIGLVMNVTPFINSRDEVILNVRPTISRILNFAEDPSPALAGQTQVKNLIPEIQVREMESVLRVQSGEVAIIGGLMQNKADNRNTGIPVLGRLPLLGKIFSRDTKKLEKTELLVFLRPTVMQNDDFKTNADQLRRLLSDRFSSNRSLRPTGRSMNESLSGTRP